MRSDPRWLAVAFLLVAVTNVVLAVTEAVWWPWVVVLFAVGFALGLERSRLAGQRAGRDGATGHQPDDPHHASSATGKTSMLPAPRAAAENTTSTIGLPENARRRR